MKTIRTAHLKKGDVFIKRMSLKDRECFEVLKNDPKNMYVTVKNKVTDENATVSKKTQEFVILLNQG